MKKQEMVSSFRSHLNRGHAIALAALLFVAATLPIRAQLKPVFAGNPVNNDFLFAIGVTAGDIDGDGDIDLIGANDQLPGEENSSIVWWSNDDGEGTDWTQRTIVAQFNGARTIRAVDIDLDGDLDVLAAGLSADAVRWWENVNGDGLIWATRTVVAGLDGAITVFPGDIDGDGDIDIASGASFAGGVRWHENLDGAGQSWAVQTINFSYDTPRAVNIADIDGDGDADVLATSELEDEVTWWENLDGVGILWQERSIDTFVEGPNSLRTGDIDSDGDLDVAVAGGLSDAVYWFENVGGDGLLWNLRTVDDTLNFPNSIEIADMDADGDLDLLGTDALNDFVRWWENVDGGGTEWTDRTVENTFDGASAVVAADFNGDGVVDLAGAAAVGFDIVWWRNGAIHREASFADEIIISDVVSEAHEVFPVDVNSDGKNDLIVASGADNTVYWYETGNLNPLSYTERIVTNVADGATGVWADDIDGDGDIDVLTASVQDDSLRWHENNGGDPPVFFRRDLSTLATGAVSITAGDLDADGDLDIVGGSRGDDTIRWFENSGTDPAVFNELTVSTSADSVRSVRVADVNGDGHLDILSASRNDDTVRWHENSGSQPPLFTDRVISNTVVGARAVTAADLDRDGDLDIIAAADLGNEVVWFENGGGANPTFLQRALPGVVFGAISVDAKDIDTDGDIDIVAAARDEGTLYLFENIGTTPPTFVRSTVQEGLSLIQSAIATDLNGDSDLDLVATTLSEYRIGFYENCGGQYSIEATPTTARTVPQGATGDLLTLTISHRGVAEDLDLQLQGLEFLLEQSAGTPLTTGEANNFIDRLEIFEDDGSGAFEPELDALVGQELFLELTDGQLSFDTGGSPDFEVAPGSSKTYFVVIVLRADAASQAVHQVRLTHLAAAGGPQPSAEVDDFPTPLSLSCGSNVTTPVVVASAYEVSTAGSCPGPIQISISGTDPNATVGLLAAASEGSFQKPQPPCEDLELGLMNPNVVLTTTTDANGEITLSPTLDEAQCGSFLQVADLATCRVSNILQLP